MARTHSQRDEKSTRIEKEEDRFPQKTEKQNPKKRGNQRHSREQKKKKEKQW